MTAGWFETEDTRLAYEGFCTVRLDRLRMPDGDAVEREVCEHMDAVAVVPVTGEGDVLMVRQYRHPVGRYLLEIPAGLLDVPGEDVAEAGRRELIEETHHDADVLTSLVTFENSAGWTTERTHVLLGTGLRPTSPPDGFEPEAEEADMEVERLPLDDVVAMAREGVLTDAKTVIGVLLAAERRGGT